MTEIQLTILVVGVSAIVFGFGIAFSTTMTYALLKLIVSISNLSIKGSKSGRIEQQKTSEKEVLLFSEVGIY